MDEESEPKPAAAAEEEGGPRVEPSDATPPPSSSSSASQQQTAAPVEEALGEAVPMATGDGEAKDGGEGGGRGGEDNDDDVVLVGEEEAPRTTAASDQDPPSTDCTQPPTPAAATATGAAVMTPAASKTPNSPPTSSPTAAASSSTSSLSPAPKAATTEPIVIDDEEESSSECKDSSSPSAAAPPASGASSSSSSTSPSSHAAAAVTLSSTEPDSEIRIASVTTLESDRQKAGNASASSSSSSSVFTATAAEPQVDMNLKITSVTSLQGGASAIVAGAEGHVEENGLQISGTLSPTDLQISGAFSLNADSSSSRPTASFNPGRVSASTGQPVQNGDTGTHARTDSWISQSASFPRNQKQTGVDSPSPATSLTKPPGQSSSSSSSSGSQQQPRTVKVTCANCKKPLKKGQTAYQRKGSTHLFCSTTCLSAFSHKPAPKKSCTMCKKDITTMKGTIVAQVDSSEQFQEFCSTGCLGAYENKQNPPKSTIKTKCTVCGKLTEIRHEVSFKTVTHKICSDGCFNRYRMANGLIMNCCEQCGDYLPSRATANYFLLVDGQQKRFCCQNCIRDFKQAHSKLASCVTCKTLIKTGEVLHSLGAGGTMGSYCSVTCMNKGKMVITPTTPNAEPTCHYCKRNSLPQYQATLPEGNVLNFCSSQCVTKFQNAPTLQTTTNGQTLLPTTNSSIQLKCNYCRGAFSLKPEILDWEDKVYQFCSKTCCEDYKKLHCIVTFCEYCQEEKTLHETVQISGVKRPFCSEGCKLLFKQDFVRRLGLKCVSCNHCNQLCKRGVTRQLGGMTRDFCSEACAKKFNDWYCKAARCDCCKVQGNLTESVQWRAEMKHFCDQECLLRFYLQQNDPIMVTQKGPENTSLGFDMPSAKLGIMNQGTVPYAGGGVAKDVKNKAVLCKPLTLTKATYCKPHMQSKLLQTDVDDGVKREYIPVPIPVPVFIPVPMNMYSQITPSLLPMPLPVPVPVFLPTTLQGAEQIVQCISDLKNKVSSDATVDKVITKENKPDVKPVMVKRERGEDGREGESSCSSGSSSEEEEEEDKYEPDLDLEMDFPQAPAPDSILALEDDMGFSLPPVLAEEKEEPLSRPQPRRKGHKRRAVEEETAQSSPSSPSSSSCPPDRRAEGERRSLSLQARYGLNAWKRWALSSPNQSDDTKGKDCPNPAPAVVRSNSNMLSLSPVELSAALSKFIKEVCRPSGDHYAPDSILYLCLGIQQHLRAKGRKDDLFSDPCYQQFGEELNKILKDWKPTVLPDGCLWGRVEEGSLWSSGHLGEESPAALLRSLVYLNTKYFGLRTADQHLRLSFANVYGPDTIHPVTKETSVCIRVPSIPQEHSLQTNSRKRKRKGEEEDEPDYEPDEGSGTSTTHCPVKKHECRLYELYRSKCPSSLRERVDMFYMQPEATCSPDSPLWFTSSPLERSTLESLLARVLLAREIYTEKPHQEEEELKEQGGEGEGGGGGE